MLKVGNESQSDDNDDQDNEDNYDANEDDENNNGGDGMIMTTVTTQYQSRVKYANTVSYIKQGDMKHRIDNMHMIIHFQL